MTQLTFKMTYPHEINFTGVDEKNIMGPHEINFTQILQALIIQVLMTYTSFEVKAKC